MTALIVLALSFLGFLTSLFLAVLVVANAETDKRNAAVMTGATVVAGPFVALVLTVFWAGLIGTLLRIEDRLTEIAEGRNTLSD